MKKLILIGILCGAVNGFFGGGAGLLLVPLLGLTGLETKCCHATSIAVTLPLSIVSLGVYMLSGNISTDGIWLYLIGGTLGGIMGARLLKNVSSRLVDVLFSLFMIFSAVRLWLM